MFIKILGSILIISSSTIIGWLIAQKYVKRPKELRAFQVGLQILESEITFSVNDLPDAFEKISKHIPENIGIIFKHTSNLLNRRTGMTAQQAWMESINKFLNETSLEDEDKEILIAFGSSLGCSDKENQIKNIHLTCSKLSMQETKAEELKAKNEKLYKSLGVLGGILLVLILL